MSVVLSLVGIFVGAIMGGWLQVRLSIFKEKTNLYTSWTATIRGF